MATIDEIKKNAQAVKNATQVGENTATRVGGVLVDLASALDTKIDKSSIAQELGDSQDKVVSQKVLTDSLNNVNGFRYTDNLEVNKVIKELYIVFTDSISYSDYNQFSLYNINDSIKYRIGFYVAGNDSYSIELSAEEKPGNGIIVLQSKNKKVTLYAVINFDEITTGLHIYKANITLSSSVEHLDFNPSIKKYLEIPSYRYIGSYDSLNSAITSDIKSSDRINFLGKFTSFYNTSTKKYDYYVYNCFTNPEYESNFKNVDNWEKIATTNELKNVELVLQNDVHPLKFVTSTSLVANKFFKEFYIVNGDTETMSYVRYVRIYRNKDGWAVIFYSSSQTVSNYISKENPEGDNIIHIVKLGSNRQGAFEAYAIVDWSSLDDGTASIYQDEVSFTNQIYDLNNSPSIRMFLEKNKIFYQLEKESYAGLSEVLDTIPSSDRKRYMSVTFFNEETGHKETWSYIYNGVNYNYESNFKNVDNWENSYIYNSILREDKNIVGKYYYYIGQNGDLVRHYSFHSWFVVMANVEGAASVRLCGDVYSMEKKMPYAFYSSLTDFTEKTFISGGTPKSNTSPSEESACFDVTVNVPSNAKMVAVLCRLYTPHIYVTRNHVNYIEEFEKQKDILAEIHSDIVLNNQKAQLLACAASMTGGMIDYMTEGTLEKSFCFVHMSDSHGEFDKTERMVELLNSEAFNMVDVAIHTGDIVQFNYLNTGDRNNLKGFQELVKSSAKPFLFTVGNHDVYQSPTKQDSYNAWIKPMVDAGELIEGTNVVGTNLYYYKDFDKYKIRYISLCDFEPIADGVWSLEYESVTQSQCDWLIDLLRSTPDGYTILVGKHCPTVSGNVPDIEEWKDWNDTKSFNLSVKSRLDGDPLRDILYAYKNKTTLDKTYSYITLEDGNTIPLPSGLESIKINSSDGEHLADFSSSKGTLATIIEGHYHGDVIYKGINYPNLTEICNGGSAWRKSGERRRNNYGKSKDCFNLYVINTYLRKVNVIKIGCTVKSDFSECEMTSFNY